MPDAGTNQNAEQIARDQIDRQLEASGWVVQGKNGLNLSAATGVAVRELSSEGGPADYILFAEGRAIGVVEAKKAGTTLSSIADQSARYSYAMNHLPQRWADPFLSPTKAPGSKPSSLISVTPMPGRGLCLRFIVLSNCWNGCNNPTPSGNGYDRCPN